MESIRILTLRDGYYIDAVRHYLNKADHQTYFLVADSEQGILQRLRHEHFDLLLLDDSDRSKKVLDMLHPIMETTDILTMMMDAWTNAQPGFVRAPIPPGVTHACIMAPFGPDEFYEQINKLLAGASTQRFPGDEGYTRCEYEELGVVCDHPTFWVVRRSEPSDWDGAIQSSRVMMLGPRSGLIPRSEHSGFFYSKISALWYPFESVTDLESNVHIRGIKNKRLSRTISGWLGAVRESSSCLPSTQHKHDLKMRAVIAKQFNTFQDVQQDTLWHNVWICGLEGEQVEYTWVPKFMMRQRQGRTILTIVRKGKGIYVLSLSAGEEGFDDFRPAYAHFLETFEFLD